MRGIGVLALAVAIVHLVLATRYGFHRDELYLLQHGVHAFDGSLDHAIATPMVSWASQQLFGASPFALRVVPAVLAGALVLAVAAICRRLGGDGRAQWLAAGAVVGSPVFIYVGGVFGTNSIDQLVAALLALIVIAIATTERRGWWLLAALVLGVGLANKLTAFVVWASLLAALAATPHRAWLRTAWPYVATVLAALFVIPDLLLAPESPFALIGRHHGARVRDVALGDFVLGQLVDIHLVGLLAVACAVARARRDAETRIVAIAWAIGGLALLVAHGKHYQWAPWFVPMIAAGAIPLASWLQARGLAVRRALGAVFVASITAAWWCTLQPPAWLVVHRERVQFADWRGLVEQIAQLRAGMTSDAPVVTNSYGTAAAVEHYGPALGLPPPASGANSYHAWTTPSPSLEVMWIGYPAELRRELCRAERRLGTIGFGTADNTFDFPRDVYHCTLHRPLAETWEQLRAFD